MSKPPSKYNSVEDIDDEMEHRYLQYLNQPPEEQARINASRLLPVEETYELYKKARRGEISIEDTSGIYHKRPGRPLKPESELSEHHKYRKRLAERKKRAQKYMKEQADVVW